MAEPDNSSPTPTAIMLIDTSYGWRWLGIPLHDNQDLTEGYASSQRQALEEAIAACPGWQMVRVA